MLAPFWLRCRCHFSNLFRERSWSAFGASSGGFGIHFCSIWGPFWFHFGSILAPFWLHFGSILAPFWGPRGVPGRSSILGRFCELLGVPLGSLLAPFWHHFGITFPIIFSLLFSSIFSRPGTSLNLKKQAKPWECYTKTRFPKNRKSEPRSSILAPFWTYF